MSLSLHGQYPITKEAGIYNGEKTVSLINGIGKLDSCMRKNQTALVSYTIYKNKLKMAYQLKFKT